MEIKAIKTSVFREKENLINFIKKHIHSLAEKDIVAVTSKIVALSQGRTDKIKDKEKLIIQNSTKIINTPWAKLALIDGEWRINAGIDESNAKNKIILLPTKPFEIAEQIMKSLKKHFSLKKIGVIITDTKSMPLRAGTIGKPIAFAGFHSLRSYIGKKDLFGRKSRLTQSNLADALAASAVLVMGEGNEQTPLVVIRESPVEFTNRKIKNKKLAIPPGKDIYAYVFNSPEPKFHKHPKPNRHKPQPNQPAHPTLDA